MSGEQDSPDWSLQSFLYSVENTDEVIPEDFW